MAMLACSSSLVKQVGLGKSAIVHSISHEYEKIRCLGAVFCFLKDRGATHFFRTIARKLGPFICDLLV